MLFFGRKSQQRAVPDESILFLLVMVGEVGFVILIQFSDVCTELARTRVNFLVDCLSTGINLVIKFAHAGMEFLSIGINLIIEFAHIGMEFFRIGVHFINESMKISVHFVKCNPNLLLVLSDVYSEEIVCPFHLSFTGNLPPKNANSANYGY